MNDSEILLAGRFEISAIKIEAEWIAENSLSLIPDLDLKWEHYKREKSAAGVKCWDAALYRLIRWRIEGAHVLLTLGTIRVKQVLIEGPFVRAQKLPEPYWPKNMFVCALIYTTDGKAIVAKLAGRTIGNRKFDLIGGALSKDEGEVSCGEDLSAALFREFYEELNLSRSSCSSIVLLGIIRTPSLSIGLIFETTVSLTFEQLKCNFEERNDGEILELIAVEFEKLPAFLADHQGHLPAVARLLSSGTCPSSNG